ncbi:hypothetical protein [Microbacterium sp. AK031]|uniref:hypothetical protein n=1 Tax=Microbacterium sp. AK031 TaxID=2723076 RepID=UPI0037C833B5
MLLCSPCLPDAEVLELVGDTPYVVVNRQIDGAPCVLMDSEHGPAQAIEHLAALGHTHIAYAAGRSERCHSRRRLQRPRRSRSRIGSTGTRPEVSCRHQHRRHR